MERHTSPYKSNTHTHTHTHTHCCSMEGHTRRYNPHTHTAFLWGHTSPYKSNTHTHTHCCSMEGHTRRYKSHTHSLSMGTFFILHYAAIFNQLPDSATHLVTLLLIYRVLELRLHFASSDVTIILSGSHVDLDKS